MVSGVQTGAFLQYSILSKTNFTPSSIEILGVQFNSDFILEISA